MSIRASHLSQAYSWDIISTLTRFCVLASQTFSSYDFFPVSALKLCLLCFMCVTEEELRFKDTDVFGIIKRHNK